MQENIPIEEVLENLRCGREGLSSEAAEERLTIFGHNKLEEKKVLPLPFSLSPFFYSLIKSQLKKVNFYGELSSGVLFRRANF